MEDITYPRILHFEGRNGYFKCGGITVIASDLDPAKYHNYVTLMPLTSRGAPGRCSIDVPMESVDDLIAALQKAKEGRM